MSSAGDLHPSQKKVDKIKSQDAKKGGAVVGKNKYLRENSHPSFSQSSSLNPSVGLYSIVKKSQTRVRKTLEGKPEFVMSFVENTKRAREIC
jgi:hypothetical protein